MDGAGGLGTALQVTAHSRNGIYLWRGKQGTLLCFVRLFCPIVFGDLVRAFSGSQKGGLIGEVAGLALCLAHKIFQKLL